MKRIIVGSILAVGALVGLGCEGSLQPAPVVVGGEADIGPGVGYYDRGGYVGDYWVWHDQQGHEMREARTVHESRVTRTHAEAKPQGKAEAKPQAEHREEQHESHEEHK